MSSSSIASPLLPQHLDVYSTLTAFFRTRASVVPELELLPSAYPPDSPSSPPVLHDGASLAIRKRDLVPAFLTARKVFFRHIAATPQDARCKRPACRPSPALSDVEHDAVKDATAVILFFDPEHTTAANWRKRDLLRRAPLPPSHPPSPLPRRRGSEPLRALVRQELALLEGLLTSPLHRHTKSPTLWHHRLWVLRSYGNLVYEGEERLFWREENEIALRAAQRHFANYYAFNHLRRLAELLGGSMGAGQEVVQAVQRWCLAHPRDVSGWAYLVFLLDRGGEDLDGMRREIYGGLVEFVAKYVWEGPSVDWALKAFKQRGSHGSSSETGRDRACPTQTEHGDSR